MLQNARYNKSTNTKKKGPIGLLRTLGLQQGMRDGGRKRAGKNSAATIEPYASPQMPGKYKIGGGRE